MAVYCSEDCKDFPCCDFCIWAEHEEWFGEDGYHIGGPIGCNLHLDIDHQEIADSDSYCEDYWCFLANNKINAKELAKEINQDRPINYVWFIHKIAQKLNEEEDVNNDLASIV